MDRPIAAWFKVSGTEITRAVSVIDFIFLIDVYVEKAMRWNCKELLYSDLWNVFQTLYSITIWLIALEDVVQKNIFKINWILLFAFLYILCARRINGNIRLRDEPYIQYHYIYYN